MSKRKPSPLEAHRQEVEEMFSDPECTVNDIIETLATKGVDTSRYSLYRAKKRWQTHFDKPGLTIRGDEAEIVSKPEAILKSPEELAKERGLDLTLWEIKDVTINEWDGMRPDDKGVVTQRQLKIRLQKIVTIDLIAPARIPGNTFKAKKTSTKGQKPKTVVFVGDQQAPYQDEGLQRIFCNWMNDQKPDEGILMGDTVDFPDISRHPDNPEKDATVQECIDSGYQCLYEYREANEATSWKKLAGNHDERLRRLQVDKVRQTYGLRRGRLPEEAAENPLLTIPHLMRLDELGIEYIDPVGDYEHAQINVSPLLAARHGWIARKGSGASALSTLEHLGYSVVVGHTHRQSIVHKSRHDINGKLVTLAACETGCMAQIEGGLGYAVNPDWQGGWAMATVWPEGHFRIDLATYVDGAVYFRDKRYTD